MYCKNHPKVETHLRCSKCEQPICPKCTTQTPVGARCPECARMARLPMFDVSVLDHLKLAGIGLGLTLVSSVIWAILFAFSGLFSSLVTIALGYAIAEVGGRSVNRKKGKGLQMIAGGCVVLGYIIFTGVYISFFGLLMLGIAVTIAIRPFRQI